MSEGRSTLTRSLISFLAVSNGKPFIDPDTSTTNTYSRGGTWSDVTACGGSAMSRKKFSFAPLVKQEARADLSDRPVDSEG